jgi:hypothetical protein
LFEILTKNDAFFSAPGCKKDTFFGGDLKENFGPSYYVTVLSTTYVTEGRSLMTYL